jgi:hypothetical protein
LPVDLIAGADGPAPNGAARVDGPALASGVPASDGPASNGPASNVLPCPYLTNTLVTEI